MTALLTASIYGVCLIANAVPEKIDEAKKEKRMEQKKENYLYKISLVTQIGKKSGKMFLSVAQNKIDGFLEILGRKQPLCGEKTASGCLIKGQLKTLVSVFDYTATGCFDSKSVSLDLVYNHGVFHLTGVCEDYSVEN